MNLTTIQLGISHLNACIEIDQKALKGLWTQSQWEKELTNPKRICIGVIDNKQQKLLGFCCAWILIDELYITAIAVHPIHKRKGLGRFLLSDLIKRSESLQINHMLLEVKENNEPAKAFYKSMGFKTVGNRSNFYKDGTDALLLNKETNNKS